MKDRIGKDQIYDLSSIKLKKATKWKPKISLEEGLRKTKDWIDKNYLNLKNKKMNYKHKK